MMWKGGEGIGRLDSGAGRGQVAHGAIDHRIFEFLMGEDRYTFMDTDLSEAELTSAAEALADLHQAGRGFSGPPDARQTRPKIMDFLVVDTNRAAADLGPVKHHVVGA